MTRAPRARNWRRIESLIPVSSATTCGPSPSISTGSPGVTVRARSAPSIAGSAAIRSRASESETAAEKTPPRMAPSSRMWRTRARVSTPVIAVTPQSRSQSSQPPSAVAASSELRASRMIAARAWIRSDSIALAATP